MDLGGNLGGDLDSENRISRDAAGRLLEPRPENVPIQLLGTQEWSHQIKLQIHICGRHVMSQLLLCAHYPFTNKVWQSLLVKCRLRAPWWIRNSRLFLLKSILEKPEQPVALAQKTPAILMQIFVQSGAQDAKVQVSMVHLASLVVPLTISHAHLAEAQGRPGRV